MIICQLEKRRSDQSGKGILPGKVCFLLISEQIRACVQFFRSCLLRRHVSDGQCGIRASQVLIVRAIIVFADALCLEELTPDPILVKPIASFYQPLDCASAC